MTAWSTTVIAGLLGVLIIAANLQGMFGAWRLTCNGETKGFSPKSLLGGVLGAIAAWNCPLEAVRGGYLLPLLLDPDPVFLAPRSSNAASSASMKSATLNGLVR